MPVDRKSPVTLLSIRFNNKYIKKKKERGKKEDCLSVSVCLYANYLYDQASYTA